VERQDLIGVSRKVNGAHGIATAVHDQRFLPSPQPASALALATNIRGEEEI
jgi:hypothetical protein